MTTWGYDHRNVLLYGKKSCLKEVCITQDANQYKCAKCIVQEFEDENAGRESVMCGEHNILRSR